MNAINTLRNVQWIIDSINDNKFHCANKEIPYILYRSNKLQ